MSTLDQKNQLRQALEELESALTTPVVSGELEAWVEGVARAWGIVREMIETDCSHQEMLAEIADQDPELSAQVEQLKHEEANLAEELNRLSVAVSEFNDDAAAFEPREGKAEVRRSSLEMEGQAFVARYRKQEVALQTWFAEAFNRDRGVGD